MDNIYETDRSSGLFFDSEHDGGDMKNLASLDPRWVAEFTRAWDKARRKLLGEKRWAEMYPQAENTDTDASKTTAK